MIVHFPLSCQKRQENQAPAVFSYSFLFKLLHQLTKEGIKCRNHLNGKLHAAADFLRHVNRTIPKLHPRRRDLHVQDAFVLLRSGTGEVAPLLKRLQNRRQRAGIKAKLIVKF